MKIKKILKYFLILFFGIILNNVFCINYSIAKELKSDDSQEKYKYVDIEFKNIKDDKAILEIKNISSNSISNVVIEKYDSNNLKFSPIKLGTIKENQKTETEIVLKKLEEIKKNEIEEKIDGKILEIEKNKNIEFNLRNFIIVLIFSLSIVAYAFFNKKLSNKYKTLIYILATIITFVGVGFSLDANYSRKIQKIKLVFIDKYNRETEFFGILHYDLKNNEINGPDIEIYNEKVEIKEIIESKNEIVNRNIIHEMNETMDVVVLDDDGNYKLNEIVIEGKDGIRNVEYIFIETLKNGKVREKKQYSKRIISEIKPEDKIIKTGTKTVKVEKEIKYKTQYKSDIKTEFGKRTPDKRVKPLNGKKEIEYIYNPEINNFEVKENEIEPVNEVVLVGVIKNVDVEIPFEKEFKKRNDLPQTHKKLLQKGKKGIETKKYQLYLDQETGKVEEDLSKAKLLDTIRVEAIKEVVEVGTIEVEELNEFGLTENEQKFLETYEKAFSSSTAYFVNTLRKRNGLSILAENTILYDVANKRSLDNINNDIFAHEYTLNGIMYGPKQDAERLGYSYSQTVGENISITEFEVEKINQISDILGSPESYAEEIVNNYYEDPGTSNKEKGHRKTMLSPVWNDSGYALKIRVVKKDEGRYSVKVHGAQLFGVGRGFSTQEEVDMYNYFRVEYQSDSKYFVPSVGLESYESYLKKNNINQYYGSKSEASEFRNNSIKENEAFKEVFSKGKANISELSTYEGHKIFYEKMKENNIVY